MRFARRLLASQLERACRAFPALCLIGPRRAGKTTLLQKLFPQASYYLLEDPDTVARLRADPRQFLEEVSTPAIFDEIQNVPEILNYLRARIDRNPRRTGQWFLTGSQEAPLMQGVTESMAGRAAIFQLLPLSIRESSRVSLFRGGFPEVLARPAASDIWFRSYVQTYLERDVRAVSQIRDLSTFRRFLALLASRCGQVLNRAGMAAPLGVSVPTISQWLSILEVTAQILLIPPFFENFGKRLTKSPKLYFGDSGLACHLLGIESEAMLNRSPFLGPVFEGFVASEILKEQLGSGKPRALYWFRDQQGLEVDFVIPLGNRKLVFAEAKATRTVTPAMAEPLVRLAGAVSDYDVRSVVIHRSGRDQPPTTALRPGVAALPVDRVGEAFLPV